MKKTQIIRIVLFIIFFSSLTNTVFSLVVENKKPEISLEIIGKAVKININDENGYDDIEYVKVNIVNRGKRSGSHAGFEDGFKTNSIYSYDLSSYDCEKCKIEVVVSDGSGFINSSIEYSGKANKIIKGVTGFVVKEGETTGFSKSIKSTLKNLLNKLKISEVELTSYSVKGVEGSFSVPNFAPVLSSDIPNQSWTENTDNLNAFDLDDYFKEKNNETLIYSASTGDNININVTIHSNNSVSFTQPNGWDGTEYVTFYASDNNSNTSSNNVTLTVTAAEAAPPPSPGGGAGGGAIPKIVKLPEIEFEIEPELTKVSIRQGKRAEREIKITNLVKRSFTIELSIEGIDNIISLNKKHVYLSELDEYYLSVNFNVPENLKPGIYSGKIIFSAENFKKEAIIIIEVESKKIIFDVTVNIPNEYKKVPVGDEVNANIDTFNLEKVQNLDVLVVYQIIDPDGTIVVEKEEKIKIKDEHYSLTKKIKLPEDIQTGKYIFSAIVKFVDSVGTSTDLFEVIEKEKFAPPKITLKTILIIVVTMIILCILGLIYHETKKFKKYAKKHISQIKIDQIKRDKIKELKNKIKFVEEGHKMGAISDGTYKKIKKRYKKVLKNKKSKKRRK